MADTIFSDLRPEAQAYTYEKLKKSQQDSVKQLVEKLTFAVTELDRLDGKENSDSFPVLDGNFNRTVFLSGGRGSGKTSLLYSLMKMLKIGKKESECIDIEPLRDRVKWLRPLQMETLPDSTNLWAAILARIGEVIDRTVGDSRSNREYDGTCFDFTPKVQSALTKFDWLQKQAAMAWNGNLEAHSSNMDPDVYAVEVLRTEQNRLKLNEDLCKILGELNEHLFKERLREYALFVLPVEDFDLNPLSSIHLARLIKLSSIRCLFTVILGDVDVTRNIFDLNLKGGFSSAACEKSSLALPLYNRIAHENSANIIRKVFPESQIIKLGAMTYREVLEFPKKDEPTNVEQLLNELTVSINTRKDPKKQSVAGNKIENLYEFLTVKEDRLILWNDGDHNKTNERVVYIISELFRRHPRHVQDLWRFLKGLDKNKLPKGSNPGELFALEFFKQTVKEGRDLSLEMSEELLKSVGIDWEGYVQLKTENMKIESVAGPGLKVTATEECRLTIRLPKDWICKIRAPQQDGKNLNQWVELSNDTSAAMILLHDLMVLSRPNGTIGPSLMKKLDGPCWAYSLWYVGNKGGIPVRWHAPPWRSLWAHDFMKHCWTKVWEWLNVFGDCPKDSTEKNEDQHDPEGKYGEFLAYCWIKIGTGVFEDSFNLKKVDTFSKALEKRIDNISQIKHCSSHDEIASFLSDRLDYSEKTIKNTVDKDLLETELKKNIAPFFYLLYLPPQKNKDDECFQFENGGSLLPSVKKNRIEMNSAWEWLILCLVVRINDDGKKMTGHSENLLCGWMARIASLLAPESGIGKEIFNKFYKTDTIKEIWGKAEVAHEIRRIRTQSAVKFFESGAISKLFELYNPKVREETSFLIYDDSGELFPEKVKERVKDKYKQENNLNCYPDFCPYFEDIVTSSSLSAIKTKSFSKQLMALCRMAVSKTLA